MSIADIKTLVSLSLDAMSGILGRESQSKRRSDGKNFGSIAENGISTILKCLSFFMGEAERLAYIQLLSSRAFFGAFLLNGLQDGARLCILGRADDV
ncbi:MAG TPA: hypothetical protein VFC44_26400 [Candidatus Saccharimonadales bacterium]|nr:hypothetical protein [Candidatus Saccharimonadales bacterium]